MRFIGPAKSADKSNRVKRPLRSTAAASTKTFFKITSFHFPNFFVISPVCRTSINYPNYSGSEVGGMVLKPGENVIKFRRHVLTLSSELEISRWRRCRRILSLVSIWSATVCDHRKLPALVVSQTIVNSGGKCFRLNLKRLKTSLPLILCEAKRKRSTLTSSLKANDSVSPIGHRSFQTHVAIKICLSRKRLNGRESRTRFNFPDHPDRVPQIASDAGDRCFLSLRRGADLSVIESHTVADHMETRL